MIERLLAKNYKSLKELEVPLRPLTVFVGPNASGKSNILDALALIRQIVTSSITGVRFQSLAGLLNSRGGYAACVWGGDHNQRITLEVSGYLSKPESPRQAFSYGVEFGDRDGGAFEREWVNLNGRPAMSRPTPDKWQAGEAHGSCFASASALGDASHHWDAGRVILDYIGAWAFYHFHPLAMKSPQPVRKEYRLAEDGRNLSTVLHTLFSEGSQTWDEITELIKVFLPRVKKLVSPIHAENQTYVALVEKGLDNPIGTWAMSDGTLFALALATALVSPQAPGLLAIEAPDTEIHPRLMEHIAEMLIAASSRTQVLVTTHSPYLLTHLPPESLVIVENQNAQTVLKQVAQDKRRQEAIKSLGAGSAWYAGHLGGVP